MDCRSIRSVEYVGLGLVSSPGVNTTQPIEHRGIMRLKARDAAGLLLLAGSAVRPPWIATAQPPSGPSLVVVPSTGIHSSGPEGGPFLPSFFRYRVSASVGTIKYSISSPSWLSKVPPLARRIRLRHNYVNYQPDGVPSGTGHLWTGSCVYKRNQRSGHYGQNVYFGRPDIGAGAAGLSSARS